jgi:hypothetical protein
MPWVGFELTIPAFEREKTIHALDRAATVIGESLIARTKYAVSCLYKRCEKMTTDILDIKIESFQSGELNCY